MDVDVIVSGLFFIIWLRVRDLRNGASSDAHADSPAAILTQSGTRLVGTSWPLSCGVLRVLCVVGVRFESFGDVTRLRSSAMDFSAVAMFYQGDCAFRAPPGRRDTQPAVPCRVWGEGESLL